MSDGIAIYNKSDIDAISLPNTIPTTYQLEIGTQYVSMVVSNYSPYYFTFAGLDNKVFATVKPWTITPVFLSVVGRVLINVSTTLGSVPSNNESLLSAETLSVTLSTKPNYNSVVDLNPQTGIVYQTKPFTFTTMTITNQSLPPNGNNYQGPFAYTNGINITGAKRARYACLWTNCSGLSSASNANVLYYVNLEVSFDGNTWYDDNSNGVYTGFNGTSTEVNDSSYATSLGTGWEYIRFKAQIVNESSATVTVSGDASVSMEVDF